MPKPEGQQYIASEFTVNPNAGVLDTLYALGRMLTIITAAVPIILTFFGTGDLIGFIEFVRSDQGVQFGGALAGIVAFGWALVKTWRRGRLAATVAVSRRVPNDLVSSK